MEAKWVKSQVLQFIPSSYMYAYFTVRLDSGLYILYVCCAAVLRRTVAQDHLSSSHCVCAHHC